MNGNRNKNAGFSLIEVVVAMTVLAVGLIGFISLYGAGFKALQGSSLRTTAVRFAQDKMETLRRSRPIEIPNATDDGNDAPELGITRSWTIVQSEENDNIWIISVEVAWVNQEGQSKKVGFKSFRSI